MLYIDLGHSILPGLNQQILIIQLIYITVRYGLLLSTLEKIDIVLLNVTINNQFNPNKLTYISYKKTRTIASNIDENGREIN
ncbi:MAG: hypothetical protein KAQ62_11060, partial [Cyclobacteriaceae bacterium]|nr:hypothetical protein [Cyclobacteriaceae bacterium]